MKVTVTIELSKKEISIIADENRKISDVINELYKLGYVPKAADAFMCSVVQERVISTNNSFRDEGIYSGDRILEI